MAWDQLRAIAIKGTVLAVLALLALLLVWAVPRVFIVLLPFLLGMALAAMARPFFIALRRGLPRGIAAVLALFVVALFFGSLSVFLLRQLSSELQSFATQLPSMLAQLETLVTSCVHSVERSMDFFANDSQAHSLLRDFFSAARRAMTESAQSAATFVLDAARALPQILLFIVVTILTAFFWLLDGTQFWCWCKRLLPQGVCDYTVRLRCALRHACGGYLRAQFFLMCVTTAELSVGFLILHVPFPFLYAFLIALLDALPIFGVGTALLPWALLAWCSKNSALAFGLLILYGICLIVRQLLEPKMVGAQIGLHPLCTLFSMYCGFTLFGMVGMIFGPFTALLLKNMLQTAKE